ncbi:clathrin heavy chain linker domain-containing protein 1-like [Chanos chanos]|uniref:Clathrin heavy chain linker domain-containing protein 1-like n=1 Tax=Chanos chanos TaxID=29144 RepID=A0A6J2V5E9_CHACN|nr:clathrin heavy chain linker domain-containing protein 1 [Chanos chanos]
MSWTKHSRFPNRDDISGTRILPPITSLSHKNFLQSIREYIEYEKERLGCPEEGPDEQRFLIFSTVFDKVIDRTSAYKTILITIKKAYDDFISAMKKQECDCMLARRKLKGLIAQPTSLMYNQRRAAQLKERIAVIKTNTAKLQAELKKLDESRGERMPSQQDKSLDNNILRPVGQIPGLTLDDLVNPVALTKHQEYLEHKKANLLRKMRKHYVPVQIKADLDSKLKACLDHMDELTVENDRLQLRCKKLKFMSEAITAWEGSGTDVPLLEFVCSQLRCMAELKAWDADCCWDNTVSFEEDHPGKAKESELLVNYIERFMDLIEGGEYEAAAFHAARSPYGILRNMETMERFKSVTVYEGELPPVLLFFQALMMSVQAGKQLPGEDLSVEAARCALQHNYVELVTHWVTQHRLTFSEALGDVISSHESRDPRVTDTCMALAHIVYMACGVLRKATLSMCKRGLIYGAVEFMYQNKAFTVDDCMFVLKGCPSLALLDALTQDCDGKPAPLSVGFVCHSLVKSDLEDLALQLLEKIHTRGKGSLKKTILEDEMCHAEGWSEIADCCEKRNLPQLAKEIISCLLSQSGAMRLSPGSDSAKLMEHVFM